MVESRKLKQFIILSRSFLGEKVFFVQPLLEAMAEISKKKLLVFWSIWRPENNSEIFWQKILCVSHNGSVLTFTIIVISIQYFCHWMKSSTVEVKGNVLHYCQSNENREEYPWKRSCQLIWFNFQVKDPNNTCF